MIRGAAACCAAWLVAGCAAVPPAGDALAWPARRSELQSLESWGLEGRVAVATTAEGFSGGLVWRQDRDRAEIELRGPLGGSSLHIQVDGAAMTIRDHRGAALDGDAARNRMIEEFGIPLPIGELRYWLVGVPAPGAVHEEFVGAGGRLEGLDQGGWRVRYARYAAVGRLALPARVEMVANGVRLRVVVSAWDLAQ